MIMKFREKLSHRKGCTTHTPKTKNICTCSFSCTSKCVQTIKDVTVPGALCDGMSSTQSTAQRSPRQIASSTYLSS